MEWAFPWHMKTLLEGSCDDAIRDRTYQPNTCLYLRKRLLRRRSWSSLGVQWPRVAVPRPATVVGRFRQSITTPAVGCMGYLTDIDDERTCAPYRPHSGTSLQRFSSPQADIQPVEVAHAAQVAQSAVTAASLAKEVFPKTTTQSATPNRRARQRVAVPVTCLALSAPYGSRASRRAATSSALGISEISRA